jgi:hypothetical protein
MFETPDVPTLVTRHDALSCPECNSLNVELLYRARRIGGAIGTVAGTTGGVLSALSGARAGFTLGMAAGPVGATIGGVLGAVLAGFAGGAVGGIAGATVGEVVDETILDNYHCLRCDHIQPRSILDTFAYEFRCC